MDFQEIKNKVEQERKRKLAEGDVHPESLTMPQGRAPKDSLLHDLQMSLHTGQSTPAIEKMRQVNEGANAKAKAKGGVTLKSSGGAGMTDALSEHIGQPPKQQAPPQQRQPMNEQENPRDNAFDQQFSQPRPQQGGMSLSQQLSQMNGGQHNPNQKLMEAYQQMQGTQQPHGQYPQQQGVPQAGNPNQINEQVNQALQNVDFGSLLQESLKNTVMEMYAMEKIQKSLLENKDVIKKIVKETLIELSQSRKKTNN